MAQVFTRINEGVPLSMRSTLRVSLRVVMSLDPWIRTLLAGICFKAKASDSSWNA